MMVVRTNSLQLLKQFNYTFKNIQNKLNFFEGFFIFVPCNNYSKCSGQNYRKRKGHATYDKELGPVKPSDTSEKI